MNDGKNYVVRIELNNIELEQLRAIARHDHGTVKSEVTKAIRYYLVEQRDKIKLEAAKSRQAPKARIAVKAKRDDPVQLVGKIEPTKPMMANTRSTKPKVDTQSPNRD